MIKECRIKYRKTQEDGGKRMKILTDIIWKMTEKREKN